MEKEEEGTFTSPARSCPRDRDIIALASPHSFSDSESIRIKTDPSAEEREEEEVMDPSALHCDLPCDNKTGKSASPGTDNLSNSLNRIKYETESLMKEVSETTLVYKNTALLSEEKSDVSTTEVSSFYDISYCSNV